MYNKAKSILTLITASIFTSVLFFLGSGLFINFGFFMWIAPIALLIYVFDTSIIYASISTFISYFFADFLSLYCQFINLPVVFKPFIPVLPFIYGSLASAVIITIGVLLTKILVTQKPDWKNIFILPAYITSYEYITSIISESGRNDSIALTQSHYPIVLQIVSITGMWGLTFLLVLVPTSIAIAWHYRANIRNCFLSAGLPIVLISFILLWSQYRINHMEYIATIKVGAAATAATINDLKSTDIHVTKSVIEKNTRLVKVLAKQGVNYAVLPEKILTLTPQNNNHVLEQFSNLAKSNNISLIAGFNQKDSVTGKNIAYAFSNTGTIIAAYQKHYLVQFSPESKYQAGNSLSIFPIGQLKAGISICHDMDFQQIGRLYGKEQIGILFVPALDFVADENMHMRPALIMSVENGFSLVRAAQWGLLSISDPTGKMIANQPTSFEHDTYIVSDVPLNNKATIYSIYGDWFAWVCILIITIFFIRAIKNTFY